MEEENQNKNMPFKKEEKEQVIEKQPTKNPQPRVGLGEELIEVYEKNGEGFDSGKLDHVEKHWQRMLIWILLFLIAVFIAVALISWFIWGRQPRFSGDEVVFNIEGPSEITSGQEVEFLVNYGNNEATSFTRSEIELRYPSGFIFDEAEPLPVEGNNNLWEVGTIAVGESEQIKIRGWLVAKPDLSATVSGTMRYWPANFSSEFQEVTSLQVDVKPIALDFRIDGPDKVLLGQTSSYTIVYGNPSEDQPLNGIQFEMFYPQGFVVDNTSPETEEDNVILNIESIEPKEELELQISGHFTEKLDDIAEFNVEIKQVGNEDDDLFVQKRESFQTEIIDGDLIVNLIANGATGNSFIQWGDTINASINYLNNSQATFSEMQVVATFETRYRSKDSEGVSEGALDFSSLVDSANGSVKKVDNKDSKTLSTRTITWNGNDIADLANLEADEEGQVDFQISLIDLETAQKRFDYASDVEILMQVAVIVGKTGEVREEMTVSSNMVRMTLNSDLSMSGHSRYYDENGGQLGSGPLPPKVGESTVYHVVLELNNTIHEIEDIIVTTQLPSNVEWKNNYNVSAGEVEYNSLTDELTWRLNRIPLDVKTVTIGFDVELTPRSSQKGKTAELIQKTTMTATDGETGGKIIQSISPITTSADQDELASDKGLVVD